MSFYQSQQWSYSMNLSNPETSYYPQQIRKGSYDVSNISTRKDSTDSFQFKYKTQVCKYWSNNQYCPFQNQCVFAHGYEQIRNKFNLSQKYKTKNCKNFLKNGYCSYGLRCQFLHCQVHQDNERFQKYLTLAEQNAQLFFNYTNRLKFFVNFTENNKKEIKKQNKSNEIDENMNFISFQQYRLKGKPRLYSL